MLTTRHGYFNESFMWVLFVGMTTAKLTERFTNNRLSLPISNTPSCIYKPEANNGLEP